MPSGPQSMVDARLNKRELKSNQGTACQPMLFSNWSTQKGHLLQSLRSFFIWMAQKGELFPTFHKGTLCASSSHKGNYKTRCKGKSIYLVLEKMEGGKISDCWEFSLDNDRVLLQQSAFLNCLLFYLLASIHKVQSLYPDIHSS